MSNTVDNTKKILYTLHGYDPGEVPLLDKQIDDAVNQINAHYKQEMLDMVEQLSEVHVSHVCPQDSIPCREFQARGKLRHELRNKINERFK